MKMALIRLICFLLLRLIGLSTVSGMSINEQDGGRHNSSSKCEADYITVIGFQTLNFEISGPKIEITTGDYGAAWPKCLDECLLITTCKAFALVKREHDDIFECLPYSDSLQFAPSNMFSSNDSYLIKRRICEDPCPISISLGTFPDRDLTNATLVAIEHNFECRSVCEDNPDYDACVLSLDGLCYSYQLNNGMVEMIPSFNHSAIIKPCKHPLRTQLPPLRVTGPTSSTPTIGQHLRLTSDARENLVSTGRLEQTSAESSTSTENIVDIIPRTTPDETIKQYQSTSQADNAFSSTSGAVSAEKSLPLSSSELLISTDKQKVNTGTDYLTQTSQDPHVTKTESKVDSPTKSSQTSIADVLFSGRVSMMSIKATPESEAAMTASSTKLGMSTLIQVTATERQDTGQSTESDVNDVSIYDAHNTDVNLPENSTATEAEIKSAFSDPKTQFYQNVDTMSSDKIFAKFTTAAYQEENRFIAGKIFMNDSKNFNPNITPRQVNGHGHIYHLVNEETVEAKGAVVIGSAVILIVLSFVLVVAVLDAKKISEHIRTGLQLAFTGKSEHCFD